MGAAVAITRLDLTAGELLVLRERALRQIDHRQELAARCRRASEMMLRDGATYRLSSMQED